MKALVTGVAGFIGSTLAERLVNEGHEVVGIDSFTDYYSESRKRANLAALLSGPSFRFVEDDLLTVDLDALLADVDVVFHQAGQPGVRKSWGQEFNAYTRANVDATQTLLEAARRAPGIKKVVYASSSSVYGNAERYPTLETDLPQPISPYGVTKLAAEHLSVLYAHAFEVPTVALRYFTVYGPRQRPDMAFNRFIKAALAGESIEVYGDGTQIREFTFVDDIVTANILAAEADVPAGAVINLSGGSSVSVNEVVDTLGSLLGSPVGVEYKARALGDVYRTGGSTDRARDLLGWAPTVRLEEGLAAEIDWMRTVRDAL